LGAVLARVAPAAWAGCTETRSSERATDCPARTGPRAPMVAEVATAWS
jgi:hypothetical protein